MFLHFYPAVITMLSLYFYRRDSCRMQKFYRRMAFSIASRKFFVLMLMLLFPFIQFLLSQVIWCQHGSWNIHNLLLCYALFPDERAWHLPAAQPHRSVADIRRHAYFCVIIPDIWPLSMNLFIFTIGSIFYPSVKLIRQLESPECFSRFAAHPATVIGGYYSR